MSLQDEYYTHGKNASAGINYGHNDVRNSAGEMEGYNSVGGDMSYGQTNGDAKWVSDQTSIIAENGGTIKVNETLTNTGAIIGSINEPLNIDTKKLVTEDLKDYNNSENYNIGLSGIDRKNAVPETAIQYGSENKEQDTNATFSNVVVTENGTKVDLEDRGINTDTEKAQVITKDEKVDQIDTKLGTDLINKGKREELVNDTNTLLENTEVIGTAIAVKLDNNKTGDPNAEMGFKEKQILENITKVTEEIVKNKENLVITEKDRDGNLKEVIKDKFSGYGVTDVVIIKDGEQLMGTDGKMHEVKGAFSSDGVIYITESTANGTLKELNRVVGEEVGEIYSHNNGLQNDNGNAEQLGQIFGEKLSNGVDGTKAKNPLAADNVDLSKVVVSGTELVIAIFGTAVVVGGIIYYCSSAKEADSLAKAMEANVARNVDFYSGITVKGVKATGNMIEDIKNQTKPQLSSAVNSIGEATMDMTGVSATVLEASKKTTKKSGKETANNVPSWVPQKPPRKDETKEGYIKRILDEKYGENKWKKGANSEYSKIKKALDRGGLWPKSF